MKITMPRRRWWLLGVFVLVGLTSWSLWPKAVMREKYARIRIGMTRAEVNGIMAMEQSRLESYRDDMVWVHTFAGEPPWDSGKHIERGEWCDGSTEIRVFYVDGKAVYTSITVPMTPSEMKLREWLDWLRGRPVYYSYP